MKKLIMIVLLGSFVFSGVHFNKGIVYGDLDQDTGITVGHSMGVDFDINNSMSIGWDSALGMVVKAATPVGATVRIGYGSSSSTETVDNEEVTTTTSASSIGVSYNWWTGAHEINTRSGICVDYMSMTGDDATTLGLNLSWGF